VIAALPDKSAAIAEQLASDNVATVYVVLAEGETDTVIGLDEPLNEAPLLNVPLQGPVPVTAMLKFVEVPTQIACVPLITAVGRAFTVTVALPLKSPAIEAQDASLKLAIV
jgi:hypothetical protein